MKIKQPGKHSLDFIRAAEACERTSINQASVKACSRLHNKPGKEMKKENKKFKCKQTTLLTIFVFKTVFCCFASSVVLFSSPPSVFLLPQFGRTEVIDNTLNPDFVRKYILDYFFEEKQNLRFDL